MIAVMWWQDPKAGMTVNVPRSRQHIGSLLRPRRACSIQAPARPGEIGDDDLHAAGPGDRRAIDLQARVGLGLQPTASFAAAPITATSIASSATSRPTRSAARRRARADGGAQPAAAINSKVK